MTILTEISDLINSGKISNLTVWREPPQGFHIDFVMEGIDEPILSSELFTSLEDALIQILETYPEKIEELIEQNSGKAKPTLVRQKDVVVEYKSYSLLEQTKLDGANLKGASLKGAIMPFRTTHE